MCACEQKHEICALAALKARHICELSCHEISTLCCSVSLLETRHQHLPHQHLQSTRRNPLLLRTRQSEFVSCNMVALARGLLPTSCARLFCLSANAIAVQFRRHLHQLQQIRCRYATPASPALHFHPLDQAAIFKSYSRPISLKLKSN